MALYSGAHIYGYPGRSLLGGLPSRRLTPANTELQNAHALTRSRFTVAVAQDMHLITKASPRVAEALALLESFLAANPKT